MVAYDRQAIENILNTARAKLLAQRQQIQREKETLERCRRHQARIVRRFTGLVDLREVPAEQLDYLDLLSREFGRHWPERA